MEVLVASIIFLIATAGLFAAFSRSRVNTENVDKRLQAAYVGRQVLDELRAKVDQRNWGDVSSNLAVGSHSFVRSTSAGDYTINYIVTENATLGGLRKVTMTVTW